MNDFRSGCAWLAVTIFFAVRWLPAETIDYQFTELLLGPSVASVQQSFDLGVKFERIDAIELDLAGTATGHTWEVRLCGTGELHQIHHSSAWAITIAKPGYTGTAVSSFTPNGPFDEELALWRNGRWDNLESGPLTLNICPVPSGVWVAIYYFVLVSPPEMTFTKADLHVSGTVVPEPNVLTLGALGATTLLLGRRRMKLA